MGLVAKSLVAKSRGGGIAFVGTGDLSIRDTTIRGNRADLSDGGINPGSYRLLFEVGAYFGTTPHLFDTIALELRLDEGRHYHVPLLLAPYSCSTYRGR